MIRHVVLCRVRKDVSSGDIARIYSGLVGLREKIDGIVAVSAGINCSPEGLNKGFTHGFTVDFVNAKARDAYLPHPEHHKLGAMIVAAVEGGTEGLAVVDWET